MHRLESYFHVIHHKLYLTIFMAVPLSHVVKPSARSASLYRLRYRSGTQWVKLSENWPKLKFSDFHEMLKNLAERKPKVPRRTKCYFYDNFFDLFPAQANKQSALLATGRKLLCTQMPVGTLLIILTMTF